MPNSDTPKNVIEVNRVDFAYNGQRVLEEVNFQVPSGEFLALIGPNGGGKTTLLKLMLGLLAPNHGEIRIFGRPPHQSSRRVGYVPQNVHVNKDFPVTALDVVLMGCRRPGGGRQRMTSREREAALAALDRVGMNDLGQRRVGTLSGGQRQRVFIARALVDDPELLFLDEPTASIDPQGQTDFFEHLRRLNRTVTIVLVSHDFMTLSSYVKSVACVNRRVHYHPQPEITGAMLDLYQCPVELVAHGLPHRVLTAH